MGKRVVVSIEVELSISEPLTVVKDAAGHGQGIGRVNDDEFLYPLLCFGDAQEGIYASDDELEGMGIQVIRYRIASVREGSDGTLPDLRRHE